MMKFPLRKRLARTKRPAAAGFLGRLRRDEKGATLAMMAAVTIPMIGMVGGAVDISRAYLVKSRLQQACDAGALAARRVMTGSSLTQANKDEARKFFDANLREGDYGAGAPTFTVSDEIEDGEPTGQVTGVASVHLPTTLMRVFNKDEFVLNATCDAELNVSNNDVMFVLDVTGSMNCAASDTPYTCSNNGGVEKSNARIKALRTAVTDFYATMANATSDDAILRFGFVPYSLTVNIGTVAMGGILPNDYVVDAWHYQTRHRIIEGYNAPTTSTGSWTTTSTNTGNWSQVSNTIVSGSSSCVAPSNTSSTGATTNTSNGSTTDADGVITSTSTDTRTITATEYRRTYTSSTRRCLIERRTVTTNQRRTVTTTRTPDYTWRYEEWPQDTSQYKLGNPVTTRTANNFTNQTSTWDGCIEERDTEADTSFSPIPTDAYDLDIDKIPDSDATRWRPAWPELIWSRPTQSYSDNDSNGSYSTSSYYHPTGDGLACPKRAQKLTVMSAADVSGYVNASDFRASGYTYHDTGMIWGARLISATGLFASENATAANGKPTNRHIIFMTDGDMNPYEYAYSLYGLEKRDRRVGGGVTSDLESRHNARFNAICDAIRAKNITIWVVAYAQAMTSSLENCADPGKAFYAANDAQLREQFNLIAQQIAELRLSR